MLSPTALWFIAFLVLLIAEMGLGTIYLLALACGALSACLCAFLGLSLTLQLSVAGIVTIIASFIAYLFRSRRKNFGKNFENLDKGQKVSVKTVQDDGSSQVFYRGASWRAQSAEGHALVPGVYQIDSIVGQTLKLKKE